VDFRAWIHNAWDIDRNQPGCPDGTTGKFHICRRPEPPPPPPPPPPLPPPPLPQAVAAQEEKAAKALKGSPQFFHALQDERLFRSFCPGRQPPATEEDMARTFATCESRHASKAILLVRRALASLQQNRSASYDRGAAEEAAASLYCLAAARLILQEERDAMAAQAEAGDLVVPVPTSANIVCAIIAMAVAGGEIDLVPGETEKLPKAEFVFDVKAPESSDQEEADFALLLCARVVLEDDPEVVQISQRRGSGEVVTAEQYRRLASMLRARFETYREVNNKTVGIVIRAFEPSRVDDVANACRQLAADHKVPVMLPATDLSSKLLGMDVQDLEARIAEFWGELGVIRSRRPRRTVAAAPSPSGGPAVAPRGS
jgi:hypothetical protein